MKKENKIMINGNDLYVARVRIVVRNNPETGARETAHYNQLGYRLFLKQNEETFIDLLTHKAFPVLMDEMEEHTLFILQPTPFHKYATNVRVKEDLTDVMDYAQFVAEYFNKNLHLQHKWVEATKYVHKSHHKDDEILTK